MLAKITSKSLYNAFKSKKQIPPTAHKKLREKFPQFLFDWKRIYSLPFTITIKTKIREFQYKVLNNIVFTNKRLLGGDWQICPHVLFVNKRLNPSNISFSTVMLPGFSGKRSVLGLLNFKLVFKAIQ